MLLSDVKFEEDGVKHITDTGWIIVIAGKVAIALSKPFAEAWRKHGCRTFIGEGEGVLGIHIMMIKEVTKIKVFFIFCSLLHYCTCESSIHKLCQIL